MHRDRAVPKGLHGIAENVPRRCLNDILHELGAVAFEPFPFLRTADTFVGDAGAAEPVFTDFRFDIVEHSAGRKEYGEHSAAAEKANAVCFGGGLIPDGSQHGTVNVPPELDDVGVCRPPSLNKRLKLLFGQAHL